MLGLPLSGTESRRRVATRLYIERGRSHFETIEVGLLWVGHYTNGSCVRRKILHTDIAGTSALYSEAQRLRIRVAKSSEITRPPKLADMASVTLPHEVAIVVPPYLPFNLPLATLLGVCQIRS